MGENQRGEETLMRVLPARRAMGRGDRGVAGAAAGGLLEASGTQSPVIVGLDVAVDAGGRAALWKEKKGPLGRALAAAGTMWVW